MIILQSIPKNCRNSNISQRLRISKCRKIVVQTQKENTISNNRKLRTNCQLDTKNPRTRPCRIYNNIVKMVVGLWSKKEILTIVCLQHHRRAKLKKSTIARLQANWLHSMPRTVVKALGVLKTWKVIYKRGRKKTKMCAKSTIVVAESLTSRIPKSKLKSLRNPETH